jgi:hypothetical protein
MKYLYNKFFKSIKLHINKTDKCNILKNILLNRYQQIHNGYLSEHVYNRSYRYITKLFWNSKCTHTNWDKFYNNFIDISYWADEMFKNNIEPISPTRQKKNDLMLEKYLFNLVFN